MAQNQGGYFTAKQAASLGYTANKRSYHVDAGNWVREHRGIYRLALYPATERPDLMLWWLWSRGRNDRPAGVFSHRTALSLHELTDTNPAKIDLTVPFSFRKGAPIPKILRLYRANLREDETDSIAGVPATNALRTILDLAREGMIPGAILRAAYAEAIRLGKVTASQLRRVRKDADVSGVLEALEGERA